MSMQLSIEGSVDSRASQMQCSWELRSEAGTLLSGGMSGRLRAGIVLGLRLERHPALREEVVRRILARLDRRK